MPNIIGKEHLSRHGGHAFSPFKKYLEQVQHFEKFLLLEQKEEENRNLANMAGSHR